MRIGVFFFGLKKDISSAQYAKGMRAILENNHEYEFFFIINDKKSIPDFFNEGMSIIFPELSIIDKITLAKLNLDIIQFFSFLPFRHAPFLLFSKAKKVIHLGGDTGISFPQLYPKNKFKRIITINGMKYFKTFVDCFIVPTTAVKDGLIKNINVNPNKIKVIPYGLESEFQIVNRENIKKCLKKYKLNFPYILHVSNLGSSLEKSAKNPFTLLKAFSEVKKFGLPHKLVFVGRNWENNKIIKFSEKLKIKDEIKFLGYFPYEMKKDLICLYNGADAFLFPSIKECFPTPILESQRCGTPVITTKFHGIPEVAGNAALYIDNYFDYQELSNKIIQLLTDKDLYDKVREAGIINSNKYSLGRYVKEILTVYEELS